MSCFCILVAVTAALINHTQLNISAESFDLLGNVQNVLEMSYFTAFHEDVSISFKIAEYTDLLVLKSPGTFVYEDHYRLF